MKIIETGFKLNDEAFLEKRFNNGVNILFSNDNNKGKTLVIQSILFSLGNEPIFPSSFNYKDAYFYTVCEIDGVNWYFLRKNKVIQILDKDKNYYSFETISEYKRFFDSHIYPLPKILKDGRIKLVNPELFFQLFFLPQDKRNTSSIFNPGQYNNDDFIEMLYALGSVSALHFSDDDEQEIKLQISKLKEKKLTFLRRFEFAKNHPRVAELTHSSTNMKFALEKKEEISLLHADISKLSREKNRELNRFVRLENLSTELRSLNRELTQGNVVCADCGSSKILYKIPEFSFEVSNEIVREQILSSIEEQKNVKKEIIEELDYDLARNQRKLKDVLELIPVHIQEIILFQEEILSTDELDRDIVKADEQMISLKNKLKNLRDNVNTNIGDQTDLIENIIQSMNEYYKIIDPNGSQVFSNLFTKKSETYSGSEEQEFFFSKMIAFQDIFNLPFPIIIDSFRDGEISTEKEKLMLECLNSKKKQIIISSTLKKEEYLNEKYENFAFINAINYSDHDDSHILNKKMNSEFLEVLRMFNVLV